MMSAASPGEIDTLKFLIDIPTSPLYMSKYVWNLLEVSVLKISRGTPLGIPLWAWNTPLWARENIEASNSLGAKCSSLGAEHFSLGAPKVFVCGDLPFHKSPCRDSKTKKLTSAADVSSCSFQFQLFCFRPQQHYRQDTDDDGAAEDAEDQSEAVACG